MKKIKARVKQVEVPMPSKYKDCSLEDAILQSASDAVYFALKEYGIDLCYEDDDERDTEAILALDSLIRKMVAEKYGVNTEF